MRAAHTHFVASCRATGYPAQRLRGRRHPFPRLQHLLEREGRASFTSARQHLRRGLLFVCFRIGSDTAPPNRRLAQDGYACPSKADGVLHLWRGGASGGLAEACPSGAEVSRSLPPGWAGRQAHGLLDLSLKAPTWALGEPQPAPNQRLWRCVCPITSSGPSTAFARPPLVHRHGLLGLR